VYENPLTQHSYEDEVMKSDSLIARCSVGARGSAHAEPWYSSTSTARATGGASQRPELDRQA